MSRSQNVHSGIDVRMCCVATGHTGKEALRLPVVLLAVPTGTAGLACVSRMDRNELATIGLELVVELTPEFAPALIED